MHVDLAAVRLNEAASNRQSKAGAALLPRDAIVNLLELVEDSPLIGGRNAGTGVLDRNLEMLVLTSARTSTKPLSVNLIALPTILSRTWVRRRSSPWPMGRSAATTWL